MLTECCRRPDQRIGPLELMMIMATMLETKVTTLARMVEAVLVTTDSAPPTSLASRD